MANELMLTTNDNPFNPFDQFEAWLLFDKEKGYDTCERLMRVAQSYMFDGMSQKEIDDVTDMAMDRLIEIDIMNVFVKGTRESIQSMIDKQKQNVSSNDLSEKTKENTEIHSDTDQ